MKVTELLALIPQDELQFLAAETKVDYQVKKLDGIIIFQLILFSLLHTQKASLRIMEHLFSSMQFRMISGLENKTTRFNSIRDRIATMNPEFFERIFNTLFEKFNHLLDEQQSLIRYDSTMVGISSRLVEWGMKAGSKTNKVQLKYTFGLKGSLPCHVHVFDQPNDADEDNTIPLTILENNISTAGIVVFDRGVKARKSFIRLIDENRKFVTRLNTVDLYKVIKQNPVAANKNTSVKIEEDLIVHLKNSEHRWTKHSFRLIKATIVQTNLPIRFLTNIEELDAYEIAAIYRQRWDIELYFKFLKQHLNLSHLVSRNTNGIKVMLYMTMILSLLLIIYKKLNKVESFKITKLKFSLELENVIVKQIVLLTGGDPGRMPHLFSDA